MDHGQTEQGQTIEVEASQFGMTWAAWLSALEKLCTWTAYRGDADALRTVKAVVDEIFQAAEETMAKLTSKVH